MKKEEKRYSALRLPKKPAVARAIIIEDPEGEATQIDPSAKAAVRLVLEEEDSEHQTIDHEDDREGELEDFRTTDAKASSAEVETTEQPSEHEQQDRKMDIESGNMAPMPPGRISGLSAKQSDHFEVDSSMPMSRRMSLPGAIRVKGIDSTDDESSCSEVNFRSETDSVPELPLERNEDMRFPSRPGAFAGHSVCFSADSHCFIYSTEPTTGSSMLTFTDPVTGSSMLSLVDPLKASLVQSKELALADCSARFPVDVEALEVKPLPEPKEEESEEQRRCPGNWFYIVLRAVCVLWIIGFVVGLLATRNDDSSKNYKRRFPRSNGTTTNNVNGRPRPPRTINNNSRPQPDLYPPFSEALLKVSTLKLIQEDPDSPQYRANAWLLQDPFKDNYTDLQKLQRFGLATTYFATGGDNWIHDTHWLSYNVSECLWHTSNNNTKNASTSSCDDQGRVILQDLSYNNLVGSPPKEGQLPHLAHVDHSHNHLQGQFPFLSVNSIQSMQEFIYSDNDFEGPLVMEGGMMTAQNLRVLKLDSNRFQGSIHKGFGLFPQLEVLNLTSNQFEGTVPVEVQEIAKLQVLGLGSNLYQGTIPSEFGLLADLQDLDLSGNVGIEGTLPPELGSLTCLTKLDIRGTAITGDLPEAMCFRQASGELELLANCSNVHCCA